MSILKLDYKYRDSIMKELCILKIVSKDLKLLLKKGSQVIMANDFLNAWINVILWKIYLIFRLNALEYVL